MRKFTNLVLLLLLSFSLQLTTVFAQSPKMFKYQTVVRNSAGAIIQNQIVAFRISLLQGSATGTVAYSETQSKTTNDFGLVNLEIGNGIIVSGAMNTINWGNGPYFVKVELDIANGTNFITMGISELLSVPYALYAENAGTTSYTETDPIFAAHPSHGITATNITNWNTAFGWGNHAGLYRPINYVPAWSEITGKPNFSTIATTGNYNDLLNKPTIPTQTSQLANNSGFISSEAQILSSSNDTIFLTGGSFVKFSSMLFPPTAVVQTATSIQSFSAILNGTVNAKGLITTVVFEWGLTTSYGGNVSAAENPVTGTSNIAVTLDLTSCLQSATTYHYRIKATNAVNVTYSNDMTFTTANSAPQLTTTAISSILALTATSGGNVTYDGGLPVTTRGICYSTSPSPTTANTLIASGSGTGSFVSNLTGLTPATTYYVRAYATNSIGTSYGDQLNFTTIALPTLTTSTFTDVKGNSAKAGGNITNNGGSTITAQGLCWSTSTTPTIANYISQSFTDTMALLPNTVYYVRAYATNNAGTGYGNQISFNSGYLFGATYGGGIVFYNDGSAHGLVCAPSDQSVAAAWGCYGTTIGGTSTALNTGNANTNAIVAGCTTAGIAAKICYDLVLNTYSDWYLPSIDELGLMYVNLDAQSLGGFSSNSYLSSSEYNSTYYEFFTYGMGPGNSGLTGKSNPSHVRAVRTF